MSTMSPTSNIHGIWILDIESREPLVQRIYTEGTLDKNLLNTFFNAIISFDRTGIKQERVDTIFMGTLMIVYDISDNYVFIAVVNRECEILDIKRILSHLRVTFLRKYPIRDCDWQFKGNFSYFGEFKIKIDEIIHHFGDSMVVVKIVLVGLDYAGKTTLTHAFAGSGYHDYLPTKGLDILKITYNNMAIRFWDLGGQRQFRNLWPKFASEASGLIFVVDSTTDRWSETKEALEFSKLLRIPFIVFANKQDLVDRAESVDSIADRLAIPVSVIVSGSALLNKGVYNLLDRLIKIVEGGDSDTKGTDYEKALTVTDPTQIHELGLTFLQNYTTSGWAALNPVFIQLRALLNYNNLALLKYEMRSNMFSLVTCEGKNCAQFVELDYKKLFSEDVFNQEETFILNDIKKDRNTQNFSILENEIVNFSVIVPVVENQKKLGLILAHRSEGHPEKHIKLLMTFAKYLTTSFKLQPHLSES